MTWIPDDEWSQIQELMPIVVVDIAVLRQSSPGSVGLIRRETPHQGQKWNLVGGRIRKGESLGEAIEREVSSNLGPRARVTVEDSSQPHFVAQYGPFKRRGFSLDPRKHAVGLTYALPLSGEITAMGEALEFRWFEIASLPPRPEWGFEQDRAAEECLRRAGLAPRFANGRSENR